MMDIERLLRLIESSHFNFLIGSGASRNYLETLGNIELLLDNLEKDERISHNQNWFKILNTSIKFNYFDKCIRGNLRLVNPEYILNQNKNDQYTLTFSNYSTLLQSINILLLKRKNKLLPRQVNLFTTNMDIFLDVALDNLGLEFNDGFSGKFNPTYNTSNYQKSFFKNSAQYNLSSELPLFNLFKLHGSITWIKTENGIKYDSNLLTISNLDKFNFGDNLLSLKRKDVSKTYEELKNEAQRHKGLPVGYENFLSEYNKLVMINPTKEKFENTTLRLEYYEQIRMFSNYLERENSVLFVTGFSFADEHIRQIIHRALNSNPTLLVIVFSFNLVEKDKIESLFSNLKYKNPYTEFIDFDFQKVAEEQFRQLALSIDKNFVIEEEIDNKKLTDGKSN